MLKEKELEFKKKPTVTVKVQFVLGMKEYLRTFGDRIFEQNKRSLSYLKRGLSSFYGMDDFVDHLGRLGSNAVKRSTVNGRRRTSHIAGITQVGNVSYFSIT